MDEASAGPRLTPDGRLIHDGAGEAAAAFRVSEAAGLLALAGRPGEGETGATAAWWRGFARRFLTTACHLPRLRESGWQEPVPVPDDPSLRDLAAGAPAAAGMEYLTPEVLARLWREMDAVMAARSAAAGGPEKALTEVHPGWRLVGRLTLHLAENRRSPDLPFAFLATCTRGLDAAGQPQYTALAQALRDAAAADDRAALSTLLEPLDRAAAASPWLRDLVESRRVFQALAWTPEDAWQFLREVPVFEEAGLIVRVPDWWSGGRSRQRVTAQVTVESGERRAGMGEESLLRFDVRVAAAGEPLTDDEVARLMASEAPLVSLKGKWVEIDRSRLGAALERWRQAAAAWSRGIPFHAGLRMIAGLPSGVAGLPETDEWQEVRASPELEERLAVLKTAAVPALPEVPGLRARLRSYQETGAAWIDHLTSAGMGACLADDMGLGKTVQVIAWLLLRRSRRAGAAPPTLLVAPASLLGNWRRELEKFAPGLPHVVAHRSAMDAAAWRRFGEGRHPCLRGDGLIITTYTALARLPVLEEIEWDAVVIDEAQAIKNADTAQSRAVRRLRSACRVALTGTPVENRLTDLWSLFAFLNPGLLGSAEAFAALTGKLAKQPEGMRPLRRLTGPFILRRMKTDPGIAPELPAKTELPAWCLLSRRQAVLYQRAVNAMAKELAQAEDPVQRQGAVLGSLLRFKQICDHPSLFSGDAVYAPADSGKFQRLEELCREIGSRGERVLVFTQFREMTGPLAAHLAEVFGRPGLVLHGGTPVGERQELVQRFQAPDGPPFFVISVKAGGTGLTLTEASHVIHFDRWWNPAVEDQATDRAYRIGQTRLVMVHKFICQGTLEERIDHLIRDKKRLAGEVLEGGDGATGMLLGMSDDELLGLLQLREDVATDEDE